MLLLLVLLLLMLLLLPSMPLLQQALPRSRRSG